MRTIIVAVPFLSDYPEERPRILYIASPLCYWVFRFPFTNILDIPSNLTTLFRGKVTT